MSETGWIIIAVIAILAIIVVVLILRRKPDALPNTQASGDLLPEQVAAEPIATPVPPAPLAAELTVPTRPDAMAVPAEIVRPASDAGAPAEPPVVTSAPVAPPVAEPVVGEGDNLLKLKGVGPKIATLLKSEGITRYAQIAAWSDADLAAIDAKLGSFAGRPRRDNWVDQARFLAAGDIAGYEAKYGKL